MDKPTNFETDLELIDREIAALKDDALATPINTERATRFAYRLYQRGSLTGDFSDLRAAEDAIDRAVQQIGPSPDLYFLKANIDFKFHRLSDVKRDLETSQELRDSFQGRALQADLDFQEGRYEAARDAYEALVRDDRTWDNLARLAYLKAKMGDFAGAERLYIEAEDELTAKQMRTYAWVELHRGLLALAQGDYEKAWDHYRQADRAYSGYWLVAEHMAELLAAQCKFDEAVALYEKVIARVPRPEFQQALGELYQFMGKPEKAEPWHEKALANYIESAERGEVHYYHHCADFYADVREDGREAVKWARKDIEMRANFATQAALAWALHRDGQLAEALETINQALASGVSDARVFYQAGMIHLAAGETGQGSRYLQMAAEINPHHQRFHVHR